MSIAGRVSGNRCSVDTLKKSLEQDPRNADRVAEKTFSDLLYPCAMWQRGRATSGKYAAGDRSRSDVIGMRAFSFLAILNGKRRRQKSARGR